MHRVKLQLNGMLMAMQGGAGGPGGFGGLGGGGPMDFGRNKSKFQEVPETGVTFDDVAVRRTTCCARGVFCLCVYYALKG